MRKSVGKVIGGSYFGSCRLVAPMHNSWASNGFLAQATAFASRICRSKLDGLDDVKRILGKPRAASSIIAQARIVGVSQMGGHPSQLASTFPL